MVVSELKYWDCILHNFVYLLDFCVQKKCLLMLTDVGNTLITFMKSKTNMFDSIYVETYY